MSKAVTYEDLTVTKISTSKKGIGMYAITFKVGRQTISQTRHMTEKDADDYIPVIETVHAGQRALQKTSFKVMQGAA